MKLHKILASKVCLNKVSPDQIKNCIKKAHLKYKHRFIRPTNCKVLSSPSNKYFACVANIYMHAIYIYLPRHYTIYFL